MAHILLRKRTWWLKRRVPRRYASVERRAVIWESLKTDSRSVALQKVERVWANYIEGWEAQLAGRHGDAEARFRAARDLAATRGFQFLSGDKVADLHLEEILDRVEAGRAAFGTLEPQASTATLGAVEDPPLTLSGLVARVEEIAAYDNRFKSAEQMRLWRSPRERAVRNLIAALGGDRAVVQVGAPEARQHRKWWQDRVRTEGQKISTANKDFHYLAGMLARLYEDLDHPDPPRPYAGVTLRDRHVAPGQKPEVPVAWITDKWLAPGAFDGLNAEARDILLISLETGCRQSEIHDLPARAFRLDDPVPHLLVSNEAAEDPSERREIKNIHSTRAVPLVGLALAAARRHPEGFPRYRGKRGYSALVNTYLRAHDLVPEGVTAGGVRHSWESRLKAAGLGADDRGELMGHSVRGRRGREVYGDRMSLAARRDLAASVAFEVPDHLS